MILHILIGDKQAKTGALMNIALMLGGKIGIKYLIYMRRRNPWTIVFNLNVNDFRFSFLGTIFCNQLDFSSFWRKVNCI